jgi:hypothetical protein
MATDAHDIDECRAAKQELRKTIKQRLQTLSSEQMKQQSKLRWRGTYEVAAVAATCSSAGSSCFSPTKY